MASTTTPGPILSVSAGADDLRGLVNSLKNQMAEARAEIAASNANIASDRRKALDAQTDDEKAAYRQQIAALQEKNAAIRASIAEVQAQAQKIAQQIKPIPLKVQVEGINTEALSTIREELGVLLGPLNGVTGRITTLISLFKTLGKETAQSASIISKVGASAFSTTGAVSALAQGFSSLRSGVSGTEKGLGDSAKNLSLFGNAAGNAEEKTATLASDLQAAAVAENAVGVGAEFAEASVLTFSEVLAALIAPITLVATAVAVVVGGLFEAGKSTAEVAHEFEIMGQKIGATANEVQGFSLVAKVSGVGLDSLVYALQRLSFGLTGRGHGSEDGVAGASNRTASAVQILVGKVKDASGEFLAPTEIFKKLADAFAALPDGVEKNALAIQVFGQRGAELIPILNKGSGAINELIQKANELGPDLTGQADKMADYNKAIGEVTLAWDKFKSALADSGVFDFVTKQLGNLANGIGFVADQLGAGNAALGITLTEQVKKGFSQGGVEGGKILTEQGNKAAKEIGEYLKDVTAKAAQDPLAALINGVAKTPHLDAAFFPPGSADLIRQQLTDIGQKAALITDRGERNKFLAEETAKFTKEIQASSILQVKNSGEIADLEAKAADAKERGKLASTGIEPLEKFKAEVGKLNEEVAKADDKFGILGTKTGAAFKDAAASIPQLRSELKGLLGTLNVKANVLGGLGDGKNIEGIKSALSGLPQSTAGLARAKELVELLSQAIEKDFHETQRLIEEKKRLGEELDKAGDKAVEETIKQLSGAAQIREYTAQLKTATDEEQTFLKAIEGSGQYTETYVAAINSLTEAQKRNQEATARVADEDNRYTQAKAANTARQQALRESLATGLPEAQQEAAARQLAEAEDEQRQADLAHKATLETLNEAVLSSVRANDAARASVIALLPPEKDRNEAEKNLVRAVNEAAAAAGHLADANKKANAETDQTSGAIKKNQDELIKLSEESTKLQKEIAHVGDKELTLAQRIKETTATIAKQRAAHAELTAQYEASAPKSDARVEAEQKIVALERQQLESSKQLAEEQKELKKTVFDLKKAYSEFTEILGAFGLELPKPLQKIVAMVDGMEKLLKTMRAINGLHGLNIPVTGGGAQGGPQSGLTGFVGKVLGFVQNKLGGSDAVAAPNTSGINSALSQIPVGSASQVDSSLLSNLPLGSSASGGIGGDIGALPIGDTSTVGGAVSGEPGTAAAAGVASAAGGIAAGVGAAVGIIVGIVNALHAAAVRQAQRMAAAIARLADATAAAVASSQETVSQGLATLQAQEAEAVAKLGGGQGSAQQDALAALLPGIDSQIAQLKAQSLQIQQAFAGAFETSTLPQSIQSIGDQIQNLNANVRQYINSGGDAAIATQYLTNQLNNMKVTLGNQLLQQEQTAIGLLQQEIQLQIQKGQIIRQEGEQEASILNQGVISRERSTAQQQAGQILQLRQQRDLQLVQINQQIASTHAQLGNQQQIFGLTLNTNSLLQTQLAVQQQITAQTDLQITNLEAIQKYLPTTPTAVSPQGAPQIPVPTSTVTPGVNAPNLPGEAVADSTAFLNILLSTGTFGQKVLQHLFGSIPTTLSADEMQAVITALQTGNAQGRALIPALTAALSAAQSASAAFNPGTASASANVPTLVPGGATPTSGGGTSSSGISSAVSSSGVGSIAIANAGTITIGSGAGTKTLSDAATSLSTAAKNVTKSGDSLSKVVSVVSSSNPVTATPGTPSSSGVLPTGSVSGTTIPNIDQSALAAAEPNVPSAQAGLPPPVLGINEVTNAAQLIGAQFTAPFLPIVQALKGSGLLDIGNNTNPTNLLTGPSKNTGNPTSNPITHIVSGVLSGISTARNGSPGTLTIGNVTVQINGSANMSQSQLKRAVTDGMTEAYNALRARGGATVRNGV